MYIGFGGSSEAYKRGRIKQRYQIKYSNHIKSNIQHINRFVSNKQL